VLRTVPTCALLGFLALAGSARTARAENPHLARARTEKLALDYDKALESLRLAIETGDNDPDTLVEIFRLRGEIQAGLGRSEAATESFEYLLALEPEFAFPAGTSPKVLEPYHLARAFLNQHGPLSVRFEPAPGAPPAVRVAVESDPLHMVAGASATYRLPDGKRGVARTLGAESLRIELPPGDEIAVIAWVFDEHGNRLVTVGSEAAPLWVRTRTPAKTVPPYVRTRPPGRRPIYARWYTWAGTAVLAGAVGTYFGLEKLDADREISDRNDETGFVHEFSENEPIEKRGRRAALIANISFVAAGAAALTAAILLVRGDPRPRASEPRAAIAPLLTPGGAGLSWSTEF